MNASYKPLPLRYALKLDDNVAVAACLLVRSAAVSFDSEYNVSSERWEAVLRSHLSLIKRFEADRTRILDLLYKAIPTVDPSAKRVMIEVRRKVYNKRPLTLPAIGIFSAELIELLSSYNRLLVRTQTDLDSESESVMEEMRLKLCQLLDNNVFAAAVTYSCPWLPSRARKDILQSEYQFSNAERGLYSYAVKMFAKANPFYLFAGVGIPDINRNPFDMTCEAILDTSLLMALDARLLASCPDGGRRHFALCPCVEADDRIKCLVASGTALKLISLVRTPFLEGLLRYFHNESYVHTFDGAFDYLTSSGIIQIQHRADTDRDLRTLMEMSVITSYWFRDFDNLRQDCPTSEHPDFELANQLAEIHLSTLPITSVPQLHDQMKNLRHLFLREPEVGNAYYLNSYRSDLRDPTTYVGPTLLRELGEIKSLLAVTNFSEESAGIELWLAEYLGRVPSQSLRYIDIIDPFLRHFQSTTFAHDAKSRIKSSGRGTLSAAIEIFSSCNGQISKEQLLQLGELLNDSNPSRYKPHDLCVNGSYDEEGRKFYLSNAFVGHRRYISRFRRLGKLAFMQDDAEENDDALNVQLVVPLRHNRDYGLSVWQTGTGFQTRERHRFGRWLNLADLIIELRDGTIQYRDAKGGRVVRLHFCGYLLANYLPAAYKLLLVGHGDFCYVPSGPVPYKSVLRDGPYQEGLFYGSVCLRRPQWHIQRRSLKKMLGERNVLKATAELCVNLESLTQTDICSWYFGTVAPGQMTSKPRLLQSRNPLSVQSFRREVSRLPEEGVVTLAAMVPSPETLRRATIASTVTEILFKL